MQTVKSTPSSLAYSSEATAQLSAKASVGVMPLSEGYRQVRRSAATIGLAISMGAASLLLLNQNDPAVAAESVTLEPTVTSLPSPKTADENLPQSSAESNPSALTYVKLAPLGMKHEVKQGESLWQLSKDYRVAPEAIAASNKISPQANLLVGQTLKIPSLETPANSAKKHEPIKIAAGSSSVSIEQVNTSLDNLRETRKRLQESLAQLKFEESEIRMESGFATVPSPATNRDRALESLSVEQNSSTRLPQVTALSSDSKRLSAPEEQKQSDRDHLTPLVIPDSPTETNRSELESIPVPLPQATTSPTPKTEEVNEFQPSARSLATTTLDSNESSNSEQQEFSESDRPVPIPVYLPETAAVSPKTSRQPELPLPEMNLPQPESIEPTSGQVYQIQPGDTLNKIARRHGVSVSELIRANHLNNPNLIKVSQSLVIPRTDLAQETPSNPSVISGVSLGANRSALSLPVVTASLSPVPLGTSNPQISSEPLSAPNQPANTLEIPVESPTSPHTEKLMADIERLQRDYSDESRPIPVSVPPTTAEAASSTATPPTTLNPEWIGDRQPSANRSEIQIQGTAQPRIPGPQFIRTSVSSNSRNQTQLVGAAPADAQQYNNMIRVPVGETVGPDLPPLSVPDEYLPDTPMKFTGYMWPTKGVVTSGFGWRWGRMHKGVDIAAPIGTPIMAAAAGEVISAGWNSGGYGNLVKVRHADGSLTLYAHNSRILVRTGQIVEQGEQISEMGSTGYSTGPHLHFEVHPGGKGAVNPMAYLPKQRS